MHRLTFAGLVLLCGTLAPAIGNDWPSWRGPDENGVAPAGDYPTEWGPEQGVLWRSTLPGAGGSTPTVWGEHVFLTAGVDGKNTVLCFDLNSGEQRWSATAGDDVGGKHAKGSGANPSTVTDGKFVYAYFRSGDLACFDFEGKQLWQLNLQDRYGEDTLWWDLGTSPVLTDNAVVVAVMQTGPSYLVACDKKSGEVLWKTDRQLEAPEEAAQSYSTPLVVDQPDGQTIYVLGADHLTAHAAADGRELWRIGGFNPDAEKFFRSIASPVISDGIIVCPYARGATLTGIDLQSHRVAWKRDDLGSDVPTPAAADGKVYVIHDKGHFECIAAASGEKLWEGELPRSRYKVTSSPLLTDQHIYLHREDGTTFVINREPPFQIVAENTVVKPDPYHVATPVPVDGTFLMRTPGALVRVGK